MSGGNKRGERGSRTTAVGRNPTTNQPPNQKTISLEHLNCHCRRVVVHNPLRIPRICVISCIGLFSECRLLGSGPHALEERAMPPTDLEGSPPGARRGEPIDDSGFYNLTVFYVYWDKEERQPSFLGFDSAYSMMRGPATLRCR